VKKSATILPIAKPVAKKGQALVKPMLTEKEKAMLKNLVKAFGKSIIS
jgi:hypothetical protein